MQVNDEYMRTLETLSKKLKFVEVDPMVKLSKALKDVQPELERLWQKAVAKVSEGRGGIISFELYLKVIEFIIQKLYTLRKPIMNTRILQQSVLLKYKYVVFLKEHGMGAYIDTMNMDIHEMHQPGAPSCP
ncbi:hypothetical protein QJS04_geneDACA020118 [Acorus gramineus]|uniref:Vps52 coiled-coil domain-containing protein n=1 Tax=Acorus gramineus TaxID=55184 RepID=A0AAV8ZX38_ACOGR|nr:hypothetical protein QJS04_geneDACA020118 [Acorus gramineus]